MREPGWHLVEVYQAPDEITASMVKMVLEEADIPCVLRDRMTAAYAPVLQLAEGYWGALCVEERYAEQARQVLADLEAGEGRILDEELEAAALEAGVSDGV